MVFFRSHYRILACLTFIHRDEEVLVPRRFFFGLTATGVGDVEGEEVLLSSSRTVARVVATPAVPFIFLPGLGGLVRVAPPLVAPVGEGALRFFSSVFG